MTESASSKSILSNPLNFSAASPSYICQLTATIKPLVYNGIQAYAGHLSHECDYAQRRAEADRPGASRRNSAACAAALSKAEEAEKKGNWKTAAAKYKEAHELDALSVNAALGLARAIEKTDTSNAGRTRAFECYRTVCQLSPGKTPVFLKAGKLAYDLGRYGEAAEIYSRAVAATPSNIDAIDGLIRSLQKTGGSQKIAAAYQKYRESIKPIKKK